MAINKVVYNGNTLIDLTDSTISSDTVLSGYVGYDKSGTKITGTATQGGGSAKNVQCYQGYGTVSSTSYTATTVTLTVEKTGVYTVSWMGYRNTSSGTSGSQLYIGNSSYGSAQTSFVNTYAQHVKLTNVSLTKGQKITIRARSRSTSYIMGVGNLTIVQN